jgi:acyl-coenzyme A thioesterase 13
MIQIPDGFAPYSEPSPFLDRLGPIYEARGAESPVFGMRILEHHCNRRGFAHGGLLVPLADITLGKSASWGRDPAVPLVTASLTTEFLGSARLGDWLEARADYYRLGSRLAFANCYLAVGDRRVMRASGVFQVTS